MFASFRTPTSWAHLARLTVRDSLADGVPGLAAQLAFYFFLALFPALLFLLSLLSHLPLEPAYLAMLVRLEPVLPPDVMRILREQMALVLAGEQAGVMSFALAGALWSSSTAMTAIISTLNHAYDVEEARAWWHQRWTALWLTMALASFAMMALVLVVGGAAIGEWAASLAGAGEAFEATWRVLQWPLAIGLVVLAVDLVYYFAPNVPQRWAWITPGSLLATALWLTASFGFRLYVQQVSSYAAVYGALGSVIVLMLWFYLSGLALLIGAELNAEIHKLLRAKPTDRGRVHRPAAYVAPGP